MILFPIFLFMSYKGQQTLSYIIYLVFLINMLSRENRKSFLTKIDKRLTKGLIIFILLPFAISIVSGGLTSRVGVDHYLFWLIFFPLVYFIDTQKKLNFFIKSFFIGGTISLLIALGIFIKDYNIWAHPEGFYYPRIAFELQEQDFANIMSIFLIFLLSYLFFYKNSKNKRKNLVIKIILSSVALLDLFIIMVNRSKMVYVCLLPAIIYLLYKKNKKYIFIFFTLCICGFFILPNSITSRVRNIPKITEDPSSNLRLLFWDAAISSIQKSPILGMKTKDRIKFNFNHFKEKGTMDYVAKSYGVDEVGITNTHNMYLHHFANYGIVGFLGLVYFFFIVIPSRLMKIKFFREKIKKKSNYIALEIGLKSAYIAYLIQGITEFNLNKKPMVFLCSILLFILNFLLCSKAPKSK